MPRRLTAEEEAAERAAMGGFPGDGDEFEEAAPPAPAPAPAPPAPAVDPLADMRARMERLERENADMKRLIPPATPKPLASSDADEFDSVDWDKEMFSNPKETLKKAMAISEKRTEQRLRSEYQKDSGTREFWNKFYGKHPDLRDDHDLVEVTLNSNLSALANIRVEDAYDKLAELTRERILRYAGGAGRKGPKARAEGAGGTPATPPPPVPKEQNKPTSISDFIRARREKRRAGAA